MVRVLFDWPMVLQYDVKAKNQLISRKFSGVKFFFSPKRLLNQPKAKSVCIHLINQSNLSISICFLLLFCCHMFSVQGYTKIALISWRTVHFR